jgi:tetratricopeptide (TPR) repeat protein
LASAAHVVRQVPARGAGVNQQAVAVCRALGDRSSTAGMLSNLADVVSAQGDHALAQTLHEEALSLFRALEDWRGVGWSLNHLGDVARDRGDLDEADRMYRQGTETFRRHGDPWARAGRWPTSPRSPARAATARAPSSCFGRR